MIKFTSAEVAELLNGELTGSPDALITGLNRIENAGKGDLTFYADKRFEHYLEKMDTTCIIVNRQFVPGERMPAEAIIKVDNPYIAMVSLLNIIDSKKPKLKGIHPGAIIGEGSNVSKTAYIGPGCVIGNNCSIGDETVLKANVTLYDNVSIGKNTLIHASVVCYDDSVIGSNCIIHSCSVIGADGFGFVEDTGDGSFTKIPQLGNVVIADDVEIGANSSVDRAMIGSTIIGKGVKLDNLIQIAHNCEIGENTACASQTGISGSVKVGKRCRLGGQVGVAGHLEIVDGVTLLAKSGVAKSVTKPGIYFGAPIKERLQAFKIEACLNNLPQFVHQFSDALKEIEDIKSTLAKKL